MASQISSAAAAAALISRPGNSYCPLHVLESSFLSFQCILFFFLCHAPNPVNFLLCCNFPGLALIMWNGLYTAEKMVIQWTLLSEACYFTVQFLGDLTFSVHSLIGLVCPFVPWIGLFSATWLLHHTWAEPWILSFENRFRVLTLPSSV